MQLASLLTATLAVAPTVLGQATFSNPVIYEDFADNDVFYNEADGYFYFSASNMQYSPGAPLLQSKDLVNWEVISHSLPDLPFSAVYNLTDGNAYNKGTWASTLRYRKSNKTWYWIGCIRSQNTYVYTAPAPTGPWTQRSMINTCYYDCGLLIDDDDTMYVIYGNSNHNIAQLSSDGLSEVKTTVVFGEPSGETGVEGNRLYKYNGSYYVLDDHPGDITYVWKSSSIYGTYISKILQNGIQSPLPDGGTPQQGSLVQTPNGTWYFMSFTWVYPGGRIPVLAPITWGSDGYPVLTTVNGGWGASYPLPVTPTVPTDPWLGTDNFTGTTLNPRWEWNHNPDPTKYSVSDGVTLQTATVTNDIYAARNTLTHRVHGPQPVAIIQLNITNMADGDRAGLAALRDWTAYIAVIKSGSFVTIQNVNGCQMNQSSSGDWTTNSTGITAGTVNLTAGTNTVWFRGNMDATPAGHSVNFSYSTDGSTFTSLGSSFSLNTDWHWFQGQRWAIFNFAAKALGGAVVLESFTQSGPES